MNTSSPLNNTVPEFGSINRRIARPAVDFPQPDSPTRPKASPGATENETPLSAWTVAVSPPANIVPASRRGYKTALIEGELTMTIQVGDKLPEAKFRVMTAEGPQVKTTDDIFKGKKVALFAVPGAYTGTCHKMHLPSIFLNAYAIKDKGVDTIAIVSVNDAFVMNAWKRDTDQRDEAVFLADGNADFTKAIGMELDASGNGLGIRSKRYSMLVDDGVIKKLNLEPAPGKVEVSGGDTLLGQL